MYCFSVTVLFFTFICKFAEVFIFGWLRLFLKFTFPTKKKLFWEYLFKNALLTFLDTNR
jgi:hypothetical protein